MIALEFPLPQLKGTFIHRSIVSRVVLLVMQAFSAIMFYQVSREFFPVSLRELGAHSSAAAGNKWSNLVTHRGRMLHPRSRPGRKDGRRKEQHRERWTGVIWTKRRITHVPIDDGLFKSINVIRWGGAYPDGLDPLFSFILHNFHYPRKPNVCSISPFNDYVT
jgi:hypothetical protein